MTSLWVKDAEPFARLLPDDHWRLKRRWHQAQKVADLEQQRALTERLNADIASAEQRLAARIASCPNIDYPAELPVTQHKSALLKAIHAHPVVIVAGETGSGKTTQLPKICLELGRAANGLIGHTQPRRLAAYSVAQRLAQELAVTLGSTIGYQVRFNDRVSANSLVKVMTDGILLAEIRRDCRLNQYGTLIIDEAHERSLNIDFILGYLKQLLPKRPDLKVIITSATLDPKRFSQYFDQAPIIEVSGRTYPVEVRYRPMDEGNGDQLQAIISAINELTAESPGDILIFMSGEREIRDSAELLAEQQWPHTEILPLYARLAARAQQRIFEPHSGRRIVLTTNVAETSLTVPGIKYVIDPGLARISRYSYRSKVQQLPIEPISQAAAEQRKGRCGRTGPGLCIRLYSEADFLARAQFTDPAILRTNLAAVILQMLAAGLTHIETFPFLDAPDRRHLNDGLRLLQELGAIEQQPLDRNQRLTPLGRQLAQLPIDPRLARMVLAAQQQGCVHEILIITAALSIQDPRERPSEKQQAAEQKHRRFVDPQSDFLAWIKLWNYLEEQQQSLSATAFRKQCQKDFLNPARVREWQEIYSQLRSATQSLGLSINQQPADYRSIHCALLCGLLSHIGQKIADKSTFRGARNLTFFLFPGSTLFKKPPAWIMVAELVTTTRLWGRSAAMIQPEWLEPLVPHLLKHSYSEPHWEKSAGAVIALEKVTLYGLPIVTARKINYSPLDPLLSRELFIRHALVAGEWHTQHSFLQHNLQQLAAAETFAHKARRTDIVVDQETLFAFYDQRIGSEVISARHFDRWWKTVSHNQPHLLHFTPEMLLEQRAEQITALDYPDLWQQGSVSLPLSYQFSPGEQADGVTVTLPLALLPHISAQGFEWQVAGLRPALIIALIKALPKTLRRNFVPVPNYATAFLQRAVPLQQPLSSALSQVLYQMSGVTIPVQAWCWEQVPEHLKITFRIVDAAGQPLAHSKDLNQLKQQLNSQAIQQLAAITPEHRLEQSNLTAWTFGALPHAIEQQHGGHVITRFPAIVDQQQHVAIQLFATAIEQQQVMLSGIQRLLWLTLPAPIKYLQQQLDMQTKLRLSTGTLATPLSIINDCIGAGIRFLMLQQDHSGIVWDPPAFETLRDQIRAQLNDTVLAIIQQVAAILTHFQPLQQRLKQPTHVSFALAWADMQAQLQNLIYPGFVSASGVQRLPDLLRYLKALQRRIDRLPSQPQQDQLHRLKMAALQQTYQQQLNALPTVQIIPEALQRIRWMMEELRVSYFAQQLGTAYPVSDKRIYQALQHWASK